MLRINCDIVGVDSFHDVIIQQQGSAERILLCKGCSHLCRCYLSFQGLVPEDSSVPKLLSQQQQSTQTSSLQNLNLLLPKNGHFLEELFAKRLFLSAYT